MNRMFRSIASFAVFFCTAAAVAEAPEPAQTNEAGQLTVTLTGLDPTTGAVMIGVFAGEDDYENGTGVAGARVDVTGTTATTTIEGLAPGAYGLKMYHDVNGNGEMDTNPFGMPTEPYAFSNNAKGRFGPAKWDKASFEIIAGENTHDIEFGS